MPIVAVYCIENIYNGKLYIGSTSNYVCRMAGHRSCLRRGKSHNAHLQSSYNKHGAEAFVNYIVEECNISVLKEREQYWLDNTSCLITGYNKSNKVIDNSGWNHTEEYKKILSDDRKGEKNPQFGVKLSKEQRKGISDRNLGRKMSKESRIKMSKSRFSKNYTGTKNGKSKMNDDQVYSIKLLMAKGELYSTISKKTGVGVTVMGSIFSGRTWSHVPCKELDLYKMNYNSKDKTLGEANNKAKLKKEDIIAIRSIVNPNFSKISKVYNVSDTLISNIIKNKTWKHV